MLDSLVQLARETCSDKRRQLMGHVATLFVEGADRYSNEELALFNDVLTRLIDKVDVPGRSALSERLAPIRTTPRGIVLKLANDKPEVAAPVLEHSPVLTSDDLLGLARSKGQAHLLAISRREHLDAQVTDVLLERGAQPVRRSVAANPGASLSDWGSRLLVKLAETDRDIRESLTVRHDLSAANFEKLLSMLPRERQDKLRQIFEQNEALAQELFREAGKHVEGSKLERRRSRLSAKVMLKDLKAGERRLDETVIEYSLSINLYDLAFLLAQLAGIDPRYVRNIMVRYDAAALVILCRALGLGETAFSALSRARCRHLKVPLSIAENWQAEYRTMPSAEAQRTMRFVRARLATLEACA
ncbi:DUF2336 domain-containing protein [Polymorphum gilvum]|uniref:DUF2336 domain-containing protein n=1 Tax=Polymorphum gilvum (strain LMG 25793 / CGMCC 1.9160 / SL003B-26A1) TaxID=991905 RepID=F2J6F2_POLGS|nr:DUF2336 domain-containing protein [Polymorphum gilvum]ADZ71326.1 hypothetical protein SL003B_2903 [Polymorphum gilvum SL003B-26A1]